MQFVEEMRRVDLKGFGDVDKFDDAETPLSALIFGDEGLRLTQTPGEFALGEAMVGAPPARSKPSSPRRMSDYARPPPDAASEPNANSKGYIAEPEQRRRPRSVVTLGPLNNSTQPTINPAATTETMRNAG
jgi:hypothetical protein